MNERFGSMSGGPADLETVPVLSIIIPVYNEIQTIGRILAEVAKALPEVPKQIVIVDDRSSDGTPLRENTPFMKASVRTPRCRGCSSSICKRPAQLERRKRNDAEEYDRADKNHY